MKTEDIIKTVGLELRNTTYQYLKTANKSKHPWVVVIQGLGLFKEIVAMEELINYRVENFTQKQNAHYSDLYQQKRTYQRGKKYG